MTEQVRWIDVLPLGELWEGDLAGFDLEGEQLLVVHHLDGSVRAFQGMCPHQEVLLEDGDWNEESGVLVCSGHRWEFDLFTGDGINPDDCRLKEYPVRIDQDRILVGLEAYEKEIDADPVR